MQLTLLGGGGFRVPLIHRALLDRPDLDVTELVLYDADPGRLGVIRAVLAGSGAGPAIRTSTDLDDALHGADAVFAAIRVGGAAGRVADERRALDRGVLGQETVGAGGLAFGLRTLPVMLGIARRIAELAPQAWTINFTNPAGMVTEALRTVLGDRVIGICDSPIGLVRRATAALGVAGSEVGYDYAGINHLGWLRSLTVDGVDHLPTLLAAHSALASFEEGRLFGPTLLRALGCLPNEYLAFFYEHRELTATLAAAGTRGEFLATEQDAFYAAAALDPAAAPELWIQTRRRREESYLAETRRADEHRDMSDLVGGGYEHVALDLIQALRGGADRDLILNVPNGSTLPQLPADLVIEVRCRVDQTGATPLPVAPLTLHQLGLVASVRAAERAVIDAVLLGSRSEALRAFAIHPLVGSSRLAAELVDDILAGDPGLAELLR